MKLHEPDTLKAAGDLLAAHGDRARILAGGTDLVVDLKTGRVTGVEHLVSIRRIPGLNRIEENADGFLFGALVTPNQVAADPRVRRAFPALAKAASDMAGRQVRNMATIGGNLASAVPSSDLAPFFIAANGVAVLGDRRVPLDQFFVGPRKTVCARHEILTHLFVPAQPDATFSYQRFALRSANALAVASVAAMLRRNGTIAEARVVLGAVAPVPLLAKRASGYLVGKTPSAFPVAARIAREEANPITDVRGTREYRRELVEVLTARALAEAAR